MRNTQRLGRNIGLKTKKLKKCIRKDKRKSGVCVTDMSRSQMFANIMELLNEKAIKLDDMDGFSDFLRQRLEFLCR